MPFLDASDGGLLPQTQSECKGAPMKSWRPLLIGTIQAFRTVPTMGDGRDALSRSTSEETKILLRNSGGSIHFRYTDSRFEVQFFDPNHEAHAPYFSKAELKVTSSEVSKPIHYAFAVVNGRLRTQRLIRPPGKLSIEFVLVGSAASGVEAAELYSFVYP